LSCRCVSTSFKPIENGTVQADYQEIKVQEPVQSLSVGSIPRSIVVVLEDDMVDVGKVRFVWLRLPRIIKDQFGYFCRLAMMSSSQGQLFTGGGEYRKEVGVTWSS
jgi:hypothetical protein